MKKEKQTKRIKLPLLTYSNHNVTLQGVRVANRVRELIIGIETVRDRRKPKYAINRTILDKNFHKQLILRLYWQRKAMKHP